MPAIPLPPTADYLFLLINPFWQITGAIMLSVLPTWGLASRLNLDPLTKLLIAVISSYTLMYLLEFGAYLLSAPKWLPLSLLFLVAITSAIYANRQWRKRPDIGRFPWDGVIAWAGLAAWIIGIQSHIVVYGAASRFGDWHEHYERAVFFLEQMPPETMFLYGLWSLPARGPAFNASAALLMSVFGGDFWVYQTLATVLNTFPLLPLALLARDMGKMGQLSALLWSSVLMAVSPFFVQQETFTESKFFTVGFILGGIYLYRLGLIQNRPWLSGWSLGAFTAGILAHYMALLFAIFFTLHFAYCFYRKPWSWKVILSPAITGVVLLSTWFAYSFVRFGLVPTLRANSTLGDYAKIRAGPHNKPQPLHEVFVGNLLTTTVPYSWRHDLKGLGSAPRILQADFRSGRESPISELNRQTEWFSDLANNPNSLLGALGWAGSLGLLAAGILVIRKRQEKSHLFYDSQIPQPGWLFWLIFFVLGIPLNILVHPTYEAHGLAHLNLQPYICLIAVFLIRWLPELPTFLKLILSGIFLTESALTTGALIVLQHRPVPIISQPGGALLVMGELNLDPNYVNNYIYKLRQNAVYLSDRLGDLTGPFSLIAAVIPIAMLIAALSWPLFDRMETERTEKSALH